eukprot:2953293-Amphidinium_carterae.1
MARCQVRASSPSCQARLGACNTKSMQRRSSSKQQSNSVAEDATVQPQDELDFVPRIGDPFQEGAEEARERNYSVEMFRFP